MIVHSDLPFVVTEQVQRNDLMLFMENQTALTKSQRISVRMSIEYLKLDVRSILLVVAQFYHW